MGSAKVDIRGQARRLLTQKFFIRIIKMLRKCDIRSI